MRSYWVELQSWRAWQACGTSHNIGLSAEGARWHFVAPLAGRRKRARRSTLRNRTRRACGWRNSVTQCTAVGVWMCIPVGSEPRHYAKSRISDIHAKVPFQRCRSA